MTKITYIPGEIANAAIDEHGNRKPVTRTHNIFDNNKNKNQADINVDIDNSLNQLSNEIDAVNKQDVISIDTLPDVSTADPKKIYRVVGNDNYTDYMINASGDDWKKLATYNFPGIDDEPTTKSNNLVKSGGVADKISELKSKISEITKEIIETKDDYINIEDNNGNKVFYIDKNGLDAKNIKSNGKDVLIEHQDISGLATKEEITRKQDIIPQISQKETSSNDDEQIFANDDYNDNNVGEIYAKIGKYGIKSKGYYNIDGSVYNPITIASPIQLIESVSSKLTSRDGGNTTGVARHQKLIIAHITDTHNDVDRMERFANYINKNSIFDIAIHSGDTESANRWITMTSASAKPIYLAIGNHEGDAYQETGTFNKSLHSNFFPTSVTNKMGKVPNQNHNYYFIDNSDYGSTIRFLFLNEYDYPDGVKGTDLTAVNKMYNSIFSQEQIDWLITKLKECAINGYYAVIVSHQKPCAVIKNNKAFYQDCDVLTTPNKNFSGNILGDIINAYKNGKTLNKSYAPTSSVASVLPTISINTSFIGNGKFIAFINGHNHGDYIGYSIDYPDQLILNGNLAKATTFEVNAGERLYSDLPRSTDDVTQDCWNAYILDIEKNIVHVVRIGSNMNYNLKLRKYETYNF